jgi:hypothetical protein
VLLGRNMATMHQLMTKLSNEYDPDVVVELLQLDTNDIIDRFTDLIERDFDRLVDMMGLDNEEEEKPDS